MVLSDLYAAQGWQNVFGSRECTQEAAGNLSCYCNSDHMGICRYCWTQDTNFGWRVFGGLCARFNPNSGAIVMTGNASAWESKEGCWWNPTSDFWKGVPWRLVGTPELVGLHLWVAELESARGTPACVLFCLCSIWLVYTARQFSCKLSLVFVTRLLLFSQILSLLQVFFLQLPTSLMDVDIKLYQLLHKLC